MEKESLTNEQLRLKCKSQFELVNYAIRLAEHFIKSGREPSPSSGTKNLSLQILAEIADVKNNLEKLPEFVPEYQEEEKLSVNNREPKETFHSSPRSERKRLKARADTW